MSVQVDAREERRLTRMSMNPAERDQIVLVNDRTQLVLLFRAARVRRALLLRYYTMSYDELVLG